MKFIKIYSSLYQTEKRIKLPEYKTILKLASELKTNLNYTLFTYQNNHILIRLMIKLFLNKNG